MINVIINKNAACVSNKDFYGEFSVQDHLIESGLTWPQINDIVRKAWDNGFEVQNFLSVGTVSISYR